MLLVRRHCIRSKESLHRGLRLIVGTAYLTTLSLLRLEFHRGLKAIDIHPQRAIELCELPVGKFPREAIVADHLAHNLSIFLLYVALIIAVARTPSGKGEVCLLTIGHHLHIAKLFS